jgi:RNA polymerase sigma-70 factor (ECF subfamily)
VQAAIAAEHATAATAADTDWAAIVRWYDVLLLLTPTPVVAMNRAMAIVMRDGPEAGLALLDPLTAEPSPRRNHLLHGARESRCRAVSTGRTRPRQRTAVPTTSRTTTPERAFYSATLGRSQPL